MLPIKSDFHKLNRMYNFIINVNFHVACSENFKKGKRFSNEFKGKVNTYIKFPIK